jgi:uncharacterized protein YegP (UPF0339 family)
LTVDRRNASGEASISIAAISVIVLRVASNQEGSRVVKGYFEPKTASSGEYMFNFHAADNEFILISEAYSSISAAEFGIASVPRGAGNDKTLHRKEAKDGSPCVVLTSAANTQTIGKGEMYFSKAARDKGIDSVKKNAPGAIVN